MRGPFEAVDAVVRAARVEVGEDAPRRDADGARELEAGAERGSGVAAAVAHDGRGREVGEGGELADGEDLAVRGAADLLPHGLAPTDEGGAVGESKARRVEGEFEIHEGEDSMGVNRWSSEGPRVRVLLDDAWGLERDYTIARVQYRLPGQRWSGYRFGVAVWSPEEGSRNEAGGRILFGVQTAIRRAVGGFRWVNPLREQEVLNLALAAGRVLCRRDEVYIEVRSWES